MTADGHDLSFGGDENVLKLIMMMVVQHCDYPKKRCIFYLNWVHCVLCEYYLNKVFSNIEAAIAF